MSQSPSTSSGTDFPGQGVVPGGFEYWAAGKGRYLAYKVPKSNTKLVYHIPDQETLKLIFSGTPGGIPDFARQFDSVEEMNRQQIVMGGNARTLSNTSRHPFVRMKDEWQRRVQLEPWLKDPQVLARLAETVLEGRQITQADLQTTDYFRNRTQSQVQWAITKHATPSDANQMLRDARIQWRENLIAAGISDPPENLVNLFAHRTIPGTWSETYAKRQAQLLADPTIDGELNDTIVNTLWESGPGAERDKSILANPTWDKVSERVNQIFTNRGLNLNELTSTSLNQLTEDIMGGAADFNDVRREANSLALRHGGTPRGGLASLDTLEDDTQKVRDLVNTWLGPAVAQGWTEEQYQRWAGILRNDPDGQQDLQDMLRRQFQAHYPEYADNPRTTYEDAAAPWKSLAQEVWGSGNVDETDPTFQQVVRMNDVAKAREMLIKEGLKQGKEKTVEDHTREIFRAFGGGVRPQEQF